MEDRLQAIEQKLDQLNEWINDLLRSQVATNERIDEANYAREGSVERMENRLERLERRLSDELRSLEYRVDDAERKASGAMRRAEDAGRRW